MKILVVFVIKRSSSVEKVPIFFGGNFCLCFEDRIYKWRPDIQLTKHLQYIFCDGTVTHNPTTLSIRRQFSDYSKPSSGIIFLKDQ